MSLENFPVFAAAVQARYDEMAKRELFVVDVEDIFASYLAAFPKGTNPIFRERTEHDCNCCKSFIRKVGVLVAIDAAGQLMTVWDVEAPGFYQFVADRLALIVRQAPIVRVFRAKDSQFGSEPTRDTHDERIKWSHFVGAVDAKHYSSRPGEDVGRLAAAAQVFRRGLDELTTESLSTIQDLIEQGALYRGEEHLRGLKAFREMHTAYQASDNRELFAWANLENPAARFRNTVLGTMAVDLSNGVDLERAVRSFEQKVAPANYKRPTALITQKMVDDAAATLATLGLDSAIERRFARLADVSVNNVLFVDRSVQGQMKDGIAGLLADSVAPKQLKIENPEKIGVQEFFDRVVPQATSIEVLLKNQHLGNFVSLTAPVHPDAARLFKWDNGFAWSYDGDVADSIKERVKRAGGNVTNAALRVSLAWFNFDDLDLHVRDPKVGHVYYGYKAGILDVDMNAGSGQTREAVENLSWTQLRDGVYPVWVNQFHKRESKDVGFTIEIEHNGQISQYSYDRAVTGDVKVCLITVRQGVVSVEMEPHMKGGSVPTEKWGVTTEALVPVDTVLLSPNHWDGQGVGNRHWIFALKGCKNPGEARGIYNEFLRPEMDKHRKVFEVLGSKAKCPPSPEQLSGVGFSAARGDTVTVITRGPKLNSAFELQF